MSGAVTLKIIAPRFSLIGQSTFSENSKVLPDRTRVAPTHFTETALYKHQIRGKTNFRFFTFQCTSFPEGIKSKIKKMILSNLDMYRNHTVLLEIQIDLPSAFVLTFKKIRVEVQD